MIGKTISHLPREINRYNSNKTIQVNEVMIYHFGFCLAISHWVNKILEKLRQKDGGQVVQARLLN